ncbi:uncharacterized protein PAC_16316 [Phialocephala subalpina]|uniref:C2H2-type domain-containing protein n=1 Tax=Phialocephala subalpina TaxID=576137 RepID=A0A1L7XMZ2_9HELO|nr:uncharacterized protein PAC_16316 [Phialocephala subalpina]
MSSEFDQYFQEFLAADGSNEFDIFKDDFCIEPERQHHSDDWQMQDRAMDSFDPTILEDLKDRSPGPSPTLNTANSGREMLLPEAGFCIGVAFSTCKVATNMDGGYPQTGQPAFMPSPVDSLNDASPNIASPSPSPSLCSWIFCSTRSAIRTEAETTTHLEAHWEETLQQWLGPRGCIWPDCSSRATFKSPGSLKSHILNIHISPLVCTYPQCTYSKPFGKQWDLRRHIETVHAASCDHMCPVKSCEAHTKGFARKDKLLNHIREQHDNLRCPYNHCSATVLETEQDAHLQQFHGSFECALGACEKGLASCFLAIGLRRHLRSHHNMNADPVDTLMSRLRQTGDNTARSSHIVGLRKWKDCPACSEAQNNEDFQTQNEDGTSQD